MDRAAKLAEAARGRDAAMAVQQRRKAPLPEEAAAGSSKRLMQASSPARREKKEWELEELLAEQARLAPQKMQLRIVWTLLEVEVGREGPRAAAALKKTGRVAAPEIPASLPLSSRPPKSGKQLWRKAGMGLVLGLKAFKKDAPPSPAPTPKAQRQASAGSPRACRARRRATRGSSAAPTSPRASGGPRRRGRSGGRRRRQRRWTPPLRRASTARSTGRGGASPRRRPRSRRRRAGASRRRSSAWPSTASSAAAKLRAAPRALAASKAAAAEQRERDDMRREERAQRAKRFHFVGRGRIFYMRAHAFLQTSVFLNHERDYMVCVTERHAAKLHAPVLFKERDLVAAATAYEARGKHKANLRLVAPEPALAAGGDVREPTALPPFARHYLFECGRLTMRGRGDDAGADVSILGVDTFSLGDAMASGNYVDAASFGDYEARALDGWTPEHEAGDELHDSYAAALHEAEDAARRGVVHLNAEAHAVIARNHEAARRDSLALAEAHARDSALLADLVDGYAPGQLGAKRDAAYDPRAADAALPPPQATAPRGSAKGAKVAATYLRPPPQKPRPKSAAAAKPVLKPANYAWKSAKPSQPRRRPRGRAARSGRRAAPDDAPAPPAAAAAKRPKSHAGARIAACSNAG
ncbi:hypothetical protein JL720_8045 [Aureococcus anophagefferens]|nr:hypothetical protein JL720_8045 [Aureococcus anophagefferens]